MSLEWLLEVQTACGAECHSRTHCRLPATFHELWFPKGSPGVLERAHAFISRIPILKQQSSASYHLHLILNLGSSFRTPRTLNTKAFTQGTCFPLCLSKVRVGTNSAVSASSTRCGPHRGAGSSEKHEAQGLRYWLYKNRHLGQMGTVWTPSTERQVHRADGHCWTLTHQISGLNMQPESPMEMQWSHKEIQAFIGSRAGCTWQSEMFPPVVDTLGSCAYISAPREPLHAGAHAEVRASLICLPHLPNCLRGLSKSRGKVNPFWEITCENHVYLLLSSDVSSLPISAFLSLFYIFPCFFPYASLLSHVASRPSPSQRAGLPQSSYIHSH